MEDLPKELVISILLRLPAEDLRRCKGVCKSLYSIITSRPFIEVRRKIRNSYILVKYEDLISSKHVISLLCDETLEVVYTQTILSDTPLMDSMSSKDRVVKVVGCCNGIIPTCDILSAYSVEGYNGGEVFSWLVRNREYGEHVMSFDMSNEEHVIRFCNSPSLASHHPIPVHKPVELMAYTIVPLQ
ncbi:hypothetical protein FEM48_ZijujUnG0075200 [Ziziphus jujuba var. spinosa]|uniref:F-box domain-containing protein n=1 Tax=Ziziphus jujuba var. spinosa TaxID=714518 RepID=A0A978U8T0_ZIZJJ|nr:hypothetical protein FEM48_ZijujUnG0075200 [Ziziphus jujuba var. spinosa]